MDTSVLPDVDEADDMMNQHMDTTVQRAAHKDSTIIWTPRSDEDQGIEDIALSMQSLDPHMYMHDMACTPWHGYPEHDLQPSHDFNHYPDPYNRYSDSSYGHGLWAYAYPDPNTYPLPSVYM